MLWRTEIFLGNICADPKVETRPQFPLGLDPKLEMQLPDPKVETSLTVW